MSKLFNCDVNGQTVYSNMAIINLLFGKMAPSVEHVLYVLYYNVI